MEVPERLAFRNLLIFIIVQSKKQLLKLGSFRSIKLVTRRGFEPRTHCLKGSCSAD